MTSVIARTISVFFVLQFLFTGIAVAQSLPEFNSIVNTNDERSTGDKTFREKEDGIYNVLLPEVQASSELRGFESPNRPDYIQDADLTAAWITGKAGVGEYVDIIFDLTENLDTDSALSVNSFFIINGYRLSQELWRNYSRAKKMKMFINGEAVAYINLADTYKYQTVLIPEHWIMYSQKAVIRFEIVELYPGDKFPNVAIGELQFMGNYPGKRN